MKSPVETSRQNLRTRRIITTILLGVVSLTFAPYGIEVVLNKTTISLPWSILFPILITTAYGWKYGVLSALTGGGLHPFLLWPEDGWANVGTLVCYTSVYGLLGSIDEPKFKHLVNARWRRTVLVFVACFGVYWLYYTFGFNALLSLNPAFWGPDTVDFLEPHILFGIFYKNCVLLVVFFVVCNSILEVPFFRKLLGLSVDSNMRNNNLIFVSTFVISMVLWMVYVGLCAFLIGLDEPIARHFVALGCLVSAASGFAVSLAVMRYSELQISDAIELGRSKDQLKLIAENFVDGMLFQLEIPSEHERRFVYLSDAVQKFYGCSAKEAIIDPNLIYERVHPDYLEELKEKEKVAVREMAPFESEVKLINPDGSIRWSLFLSRPRMINGIQCWDGIEIDITERKKIELELLETKEKAEENNRLKTAFLQNISHEIRTPLNAIVGFANLLGDKSISLEERDSFIPIIQSSSKQLLAIVSDVLSISSIITRQEKIRVESVIVPDLLKELLVSFSESNEKEKVSIELNMEDLDADLVVSTDRTKLTQILSNLLQNALKFTEKGLVEFGCRRDFNGNPDFLVFYVKDSGVGIQERDLDKIFDRFVRGTHERGKSFAGTGLGLSICKGFAELLGGEIWAESELGKGSVFSFSIPYSIQSFSESDDSFS